MKRTSLTAAVLTTLAACHCSPVLSQSGVLSDSPPMLRKVDQRGFIDVWQLRQDVAAVEKLHASDETDRCYPEGDPDEHPSTKELKQREQDAKACEATIHRNYAVYRKAYEAFNASWLPALWDAFRKGDPIAELVLRHCETTEAIDRSGIESTCDEAPQRRTVALERLKKIGFLPAIDLHAEITTRYPNPSEDQPFLTLNQLATLKKFASGALGLGFEDRYIRHSGNSPKTEPELEMIRRWTLIEAVQQDARRAFTFSPESNEAGWATSAFGALRINRKPLTPGFLTWGQTKHYGGSNSPYTGPYYWRDQPKTVYFGKRPAIQAYAGNPPKIPGEMVIAGLEHEEFAGSRNALLAEMAVTINRFLKQDSRWGIFLLTRIGHHEWVPEGMESTTHRLDPAWEGNWVLEKESQDWSKPMAPASGNAVIRRDGEYVTMTVVAEGQREPLLNVTDCVLRYSGGRTYLPKLTPDGQDALNTLLGYFYSNGAAPSGRFLRSGENREAVAPFDPKKRYKQVLMQCDNAESQDSTRVRFLLLAEGVLVEFGATRPFGEKLAVRHYRRLN